MYAGERFFLTRHYILWSLPVEPALNLFQGHSLVGSEQRAAFLTV